MKSMHAEEILRIPGLRHRGRTFYDGEEKILYMNWTCSGVEFLYTGTCLEVELRAVPGAEIDDPIHHSLPPRDTWPWVGVCLDDAEELAEVFEVGEKDCVKRIYTSEQVETHRIRLVKLTENPKGKIGIRGFRGDGEIGGVPAEQKKLVEFVGDSITCGFGNMSCDASRLFWSEDENGWYSHGAIAGRILKDTVETELISYSGICAVNHTWLPQPYGMQMLYPYQDRVLEDLGEPGKDEAKLRIHDFASRPRAAVVLNLGTNDATGIMFQEDKPAAEAEFIRDYPELIRQIRRLNGPQTQIICALGSIDYMLYSDIEKIVERYRAETGDEKIHTFRYYKMAPPEGIAPCGHPTRATQERMGREIADYLRELLKTE